MGSVMTFRRGHLFQCTQLRRLLVVIFSLVMLAMQPTPIDAIRRRGVSSSQSSSSSRCIGSQLGIGTAKKRFFYSNGVDLPIRIEISGRPSHQLMSRVLRILLTELVGHDKVQLIPVGNDINPRLSLGRFSRLNIQDGSPEVMINLELWLQGGINMDSINDGTIISGGSLGSLGRFGWFVSSSTVSSHWNSSRTIIDHWRSLTVPNITSMFANLNLDELRELTRPNSSSPSYCHQFLSSNDESEKKLLDSDCLDGIYRPPLCQLPQSRCAILLASYPDLYGPKLVEQIRSLSLNVRIAWIGEHLYSYVRESSHHPLLFFDWVPNVLMTSKHYSHVHFPICTTAATSDTKHLGDNSDVNPCDFRSHQLTKIMWSKLQTHTPETYHVIKNLQFSSDDLNLLLESYARTRKDAAAGGHLSGLGWRSSELIELMEQAACKWVLNNEAVWRPWLPKTLSSKQVIYLGGMFPLTGPYWRQPAIVPGAQMAIQYINSDPTILGDYELKMLVVDTQCTVNIAMEQFLNYVVDKTYPIAGILGPGCSETAEPIAGVSKHFNTIVISYSAESLKLTNRDLYPLFFRTIPDMLQNSEVYIEMFQRWQWTQVALLAEDWQNYPEYQAFLKDQFQSHSIQVVYDRKIPRQTRLDQASKINKTDNVEMIYQFLDEVKKKEVKIIILTSFEDAAVAVLCEAHRKGMTAADGYVWFLSPWFTLNWWDHKKSHGNKSSADAIPCSSDEILEAIQSHFILNSAYLGPEESHIVGNNTVRGWFDSYLKLMDEWKVEYSQYASYAYDAVFVFALGLHNLLTEDPSALESLHTDNTVERFMYYLNNTHFSGASGPVAFSGADRTGIININQQIGNTSHVVGQFLPEARQNLSDRLELKEDQIRWLTPNGLRPSDGTMPPSQCRIESFRRLLDSECETAIVVANVIAISGILIIVTLFAVLTKIRYDRQMRLFKEQNGIYANSAWPMLDTWELPKDRVVLNRKLGEGAFGTVYGGEALIEDIWVAVAVKTLKVGSNTEEKMDFLSEAEMMKRLEHKNIVRLLGVCTRGEPVYAVMEFMLHGDLKTFLLSRRQMVGQNTKEAEDVNALGLTQMALDVAYGLQYLCELKYVHRDLASRNCLVHANKTVKIGDFGMTRPMYDSDYYRFNKRGMFPVRWMAPESLVDGIFRTSSDIWSYGVLLYEIMTFGSFPYQGLSNRQVLTFVKSGQKITLPLACPDKLHQLVLQCWSYDATARPSVTDIIETLRLNSTLIQPCLDAPCSAITFEGTASLEMSLAPKSRAVRLSNPRRPSGGEVLSQRRGLSTSSSHGGGGGGIGCFDEDAKLSADDYSPDAVRASLIDPFGLMVSSCAGSGTTQPSLELVPRYCRTSSGTPAMPLLASHNNSSRVSFDSFVRNAVFCRSMSGSDPDRRTSAVNIVRGELTADVADVTVVLEDDVIGSDFIVGGSTESLRGRGLNRNDDCNSQRAPTSSLESRGDSDYCSQHSKDFTTNINSGGRSRFAPFV